MKSDHDAPPSRPEASPALTGAAAVPVEFLDPLLEDFPDPVVVTNRDREVVFLNCAAKKLFGETLRPGDPCPICSGMSIIAGTGEDASRLRQCPQARGELQASAHSAQDPLAHRRPPLGERHTHPGRRPRPGRLFHPHSGAYRFADPPVDGTADGHPLQHPGKFPRALLHGGSVLSGHPYQRAHGETHRLLPAARWWAG